MDENYEKMPIAVRIVLCGFVILAVSSCSLPVLWVVLWLRQSLGVEALLWRLLAWGGIVSMLLGSALAIVHRGRKWAMILWLLLGVYALLTVPPDPDAILGAIAVVVALPVVFLALPSSGHWFKMKRPANKHIKVGGCVLLIFAVMGMFTLIIDEPSDSFMERCCAQAMRGRNVYVMMSRNEEALSSGLHYVDIRTSKDSLEFAERLCLMFGGNAELAELVGKEWSFVVNAPDDAPDSFPLMISANVDPARLPREWDGQPEGDERIAPVAIEGADPLPIGSRAVIVVRKNGSVDVIKVRDMKLGTIFGRPYELGGDVYFLTPVGMRHAL